MTAAILAALLAWRQPGVWHAESRFLREVHEGTIRGDNGKADCLGSIHPHDPHWDDLSGTDLEATRRCARSTIRHLRSSIWLCARGVRDEHRRLSLAFEHYARGTCAEPGLESCDRASTFRVVLQRIQRATWEARP